MALDPLPDDQAEEEARKAEKTAANVLRLLARGSDVELADGSTATVVFGARILALIEAEYGSVNALLDRLGEGPGGPLYQTLAFVFSLVLRQPIDKIWDLIDTRQADDYTEAIIAAYLEAVPRKSNQGNGQGPKTAPSPGPNSSTSSSRSSTSPLANSGS